jgi:DNA-binding response OmpR family regulator
MDRPLAGRVILIIEDEPLVALGISDALQDVGAKTITARTLAAALVAIEEPSLSAAIVDHALGDGDSSELCQRLKERDVPFLMYSGYSTLAGACAGGVHVNKPATPALLVTTVKALLAQRPISN